MPKKPKSFRMSDKAMQNLQWLVAISGANETAVLEMALGYFRQTYYATAEPFFVGEEPAVPIPEVAMDLPSVKKLATRQTGAGDAKAAPARKRKRRR